MNLLLIIYHFQRLLSPPAVSPTNQAHLFLIERNQDSDKIYYDISFTKGGELHPQHPIKGHWLRSTAGGCRQPLTWSQNEFSFGLKFRHMSSSEIHFQLVSYKDRDFILKKDSEGHYKVYTQFLGREIQLERIFIQIDGGSFWLPRISRVELHGSLADTGCQTLEINRPQEASIK
jgi:hypothetical protein